MFQKCIIVKIQIILKMIYLLYIYFFQYINVQKSNLWENNPLINNAIPNIIARSRYRQINKYICNSDNPFIYTKIIYYNNKSQILNFLMDYCDKKWKNMYSFAQLIAIYESM